MCGITGFIDLSGRTSQEELERKALYMAGTIHYRGPDDEGVWADESSGIALSHRRLSILDLSPEGHQPMFSASGRYVIVFNGEVYNFEELRKGLEPSGHVFRGHSDTEIMLAAFEQWGVRQAVHQFVGMFAFALWDRKERVLYLVRDRLGIKPLYYGWMGSTFLFGSELKALRVHPDFKAEINRNALCLYLRHNYLPSPYCIYNGIYKLPPGCILKVKDHQINHPEPYWSAREAVEKGVSEPFAGGESEALDQLHQHLKEAVKLRMIADVPLGAFLSGGIDSSTVVALMQALSERPVKTFTIGFYESGYNEAKDAKAVARQLGTDHIELYVTPEETMKVVPLLPALYDEPFADSSQIPTFLVSQLARRHVTVSLSGDGGDELFAGYNRYFWGRKIWQKIGWMPDRIKRVSAGALTALSPEMWESIYNTLNPILPGSLKQRTPGDKLHKLAEIMVTDNPEALYLHLVSHWKDPASMVPGGSELPTALTDSSRWANLPDFTMRMMYLDLVTYLPDDILTKVDRASMGVSLEARVPLLDHRLVSFAWRLPLSLKIRDGEGKWLLRQVLYKYVSRDLIERPKMGFGVPIDAWLRGPLREWAESLLDEQRLIREGFFDPRPIRIKWSEHLSGKRNWQYYLWNILMFQSWVETNGGFV